MSWMLRWFIPENTISPTLDGERAAPATVEAGHPATSEPWFSQTSSGHIGPIRIPPGFFSLAAFLLLVLAIARIVSTYHVFNQTDDEPAHLACGMEWLDQGKYHYEHQHPPLARVAVAIGPYLAGLRSARQEDMFQEGNTILYSGGLYFRNLSLARLGVLPFFILACVLVWLWSRRLFGNSAALAATLLFSTLPPILAHAGLATTDMAISTFVFGATYAFALWLERPGWKQSVLFGLCVAMATLSKFSALLFLPVCLLVTLLLYLRAERPSIYQASRKIPSAVLVLTVAILVVWAGYRFSFGPLAPDVRVGNRPPQTIDRLVDHVSLPAPELFNGLAEVQFHNSVGHPAWLLGEYSNHGWWYFFPVVLAVKTPIAFILPATARLLKSTILKSKDAPFHLETPPIAAHASIAGVTRDRSRQGVPLSCGTGIMLVSLLLWAATNFPMHHGQPPEIQNSVVAQLGQAIEPVIVPWLRPQDRRRPADLAGGARSHHRNSGNVEWNRFPIACNRLASGVGQELT